MGADPIATAVCLVAGARSHALQSFIVRKQPKDHGTLAWIEGAKKFPPQANLIVVEDVVTTGGSSIRAAEKLREAGFIVKTVLSVMDREEGARQAMNEAGLNLISLSCLRELPLRNKG